VIASYSLIFRTTISQVETWNSFNLHKPIYGSYSGKPDAKVAKKNKELEHQR
jgi:hypothetical protein